MPRQPAPKMEWARFNLRIWCEESAKYRLLTPEDRRLAAALYLRASAEGHIPDTDLALATAAWENDTSRVAEIRAKLPTFGFMLREGRWIEKNALEVYDKARHISLMRAAVGSLGGRAKATANATANAEANAVATPSPSPSPSPSSVDVESVGVSSLDIEKGTVESSKALTLFEPPVESEAVVIPPQSDPVTRCVEQYLKARAWMLGREPRALSAGTIASLRKRMQKRLSEKFPPELLVSLPVFVEDGNFSDGTDRVTAMLRDPEILLREDNAQGGKLHARRIESTLDGRFVNARRVQILEALCTWEWAQSQGVKAKGTYARGGA